MSSVSPPSNVYWKRYQLRILLWQILLFHCCHVLSAGEIVTSLPDFDGDLPFKLETGYVHVEGSELFYYFLESEGNPNKDPFMLWFSGGPGCSAFAAIIDEIGPIRWNLTAYEYGPPKLEYYEYSWTKTASILFVDSPVGAGYSYAPDPANYATSDTKWALQNYIFLKKWLLEHPQYLEVELFIGSDSYGGIPAPLVVQHILDGNKALDYPYLNLKGYILGCPFTNQYINGNSNITFSHRLGLVSDELYEAATEACGGNYYFQNDSSNYNCTESVNLIKQMIKDVNNLDILEARCLRPKLGENNKQGRKSDRSLLDNSQSNRIWCPRDTDYSLSDTWQNNPRVRQALHVREGTIEEWIRCNDSISYNYDMNMDVLAYHRNFTKTTLVGLVFSGDHDMRIPNVGTQEWISTLNLTVDDAWHPWLVDGEVAGYTELYKDKLFRLRYATLKGAGHTPQESKRREAYDMFFRWVHYYPL